MLFAQSTGIVRVSDKGGKPDVLVPSKDSARFYGPQMLPGNRAVLFTVAGNSQDPATRWNQASVVVQPLPSGDPVPVVEGASDGRYVPTGHLVYARGGTLFAVAFDPEKLTKTGREVPLLEGVRRSSAVGPNRTGAAHFAFSTTGVLAYLPGPKDTVTSGRDLVVVSPSGEMQRLKNVPLRGYESPRVSPDDRFIAVTIDDGQQVNIHIYDMTSGSMRRLTHGGRNRYPIWSPDGSRIAFQSDREGRKGIYWQRADGADVPEELTKSEPGTSHVPESWPRPGDLFSYSVIADKDGSASLWTYSVRERRAAAVGTLHAIRAFNSAFSPDGRFIAYTDRQLSEGVSLVVEPFPPTGARHEIAGNDQQGHHAVWSRDSKRLFYFPGALPMASVEVNAASGFAFSTPSSIPGGWVAGASGVTSESPTNHDVFLDGRFVVAMVAGAQPETNPGAIVEVRVIVPWFEELKRLVPTK